MTTHQIIPIAAWAAAAWLVAVNLWAFTAFGIDKRRALGNEQRLSESLLLKLTASGGTLGALAAMRLFRHKTRKQPFQTRFWSIVALQAGVALGVLAWIFLHK